MKMAAAGIMESRVNRRSVQRMPLMILEVKGKKFDKVFIAQAEDLGPGGLRLASSAQLKVGDRFPIEFVLPDHESKIECSCEVAWKKEVGPASDGVGLRFVDLSPKAKSVIEAWVDKEEKKKAGS
jgi:Tfp pilus assembly protein PilZ